MRLLLALALGILLSACASTTPKTATTPAPAPRLGYLDRNAAVQLEEGGEGIIVLPENTPFYVVGQAPDDDAFYMVELGGGRRARVLAALVTFSPSEEALASQRAARAQEAQPDFQERPRARDANLDRAFGETSSASEPETAHHTSSRSGSGSVGSATCSDFSTRAAAEAAYRAGNTRLDGDGDGVPCESLRDRRASSTSPAVGSGSGRVHVRGHYRTTRSGRRVYVRPHTRSRPRRGN